MLRSSGSGKKKCPHALCQIAGILAALQACLQTRVGNSSDVDKKAAELLLLDLSPVGKVMLWMNPLTFNWRRKLLQVFINSRLSAEAELVNTWGISGRERKLRRVLLQRRTRRSQHVSLCVMRLSKDRKLQNCNNMMMNCSSLKNFYETENKSKMTQLYI